MSTPPSLTLFVQQAYTKASLRNFDTQQQAVLQLQLRQLIQQANDSGKIWKNDWSRQLLPILDNVPLKLHCDALPKSKRNSDSMSSESRKKSRLQRFENDQPSSSSPSPQTTAQQGPIRGTCQTLEKGYLRLTSAPDPAKVRPLQVLKRSFQFIYKKYVDGNANYSYICDQFKSMRQDLKVQLVEDEFTVTVYETHARIAIENKDLSEFNQCQNQLKNLYGLSHIKKSANYHEFLSYRILYFILTKNFDQIILIKMNLSKLEKNNNFIKFALDFLKFKISNNYYRLFKLYSNSHSTTRYLLDYFINNERIIALSIICYSYKIINLEFLLNQFNFKNESDCMDFINAYKIDKFIELRGENVYLNTALARSTVLQSLNDSKKVDIKGQI